MIEITPEEQNKEKGMKRIEDSLRDIWDNIKCTNIQIRGSRRRREKRKRMRKYLRRLYSKNSIHKQVGPD